MMASPDTLQQEYRNRFGSAEAYRQRVWKVLCDKYFADLIPADATLLDVGSGWGEFVNQIHAAKKYAMDLNPDGGSRLAPGVEFLLQDCSEPWPLEDGTLDVVFSSNFLEHLPNKLAIERTLRHAFAALKPGGRIVLLGPNIRFLADVYWDFWDHHIAISDRSLCEQLLLSGFDIESCVDRFLPYTMSDSREAPLFLVRAYLSMPWAWRFMGKQFLIVGRKPLP